MSPEPVENARGPERDARQTRRAALLVSPIAAAAIAHGGIQPGTQAALFLVLMVGVAAWILGRVRRGGIRLKRSAPDAMLLLLLAAGILSTLFSTCVHDSILALCLATGYLLYYLLWTQLLEGEGSLRRAIWLLLAFGAAYALLSLLIQDSSLLGIRLFSRPGRRLALTFANPNHFAAFLDAIGFLGIGLALSRRGAERWLALCLVLGVLAAVALSASRAGVLALLSGFSFLAVSAFLRLRERRPILVLGVVGLGLAAAVGLVASRSTLSRLAMALAPARALDSRLPIWQTALEVMRERPLLGSGPGTFGDAARAHQSELTARSFLNYAHNDLLQLGAETGLLGLALALAAIGTLYISCLRRPRYPAEESLRWLGLGALSACTATLVHSLFDFQLRLPSNALLFVACAAIGVLSVRGEDAWFWASARIPRARRSLWRWLTLSASIAMSVLFLAPYAAAELRASAQRLRASDPQAALRWSRLSLGLAPLDPGAWSETGRMQSLVAAAAEEPERRKRLQRAAYESYAKALALGPRKESVAIAYAEELVASGHDAMARQALRKLEQIAPMSPSAWYRRGLLLLAMDDRPEAIPALRSALRLDPRLLGPLLAELERRGADAALLREAVPALPALRAQLSEHFYATGRDEAAVEELALAYRLEPDAIRAARHLAGLSRAGRIEEAGELSRRYFARHADSAPLVAAAAGALLAAGEVDLAGEAAERWLRLRPADPAASRLLGSIRRLAGDYPAAIRALSAAATRAPGDARIQIELGLCHTANAEPELALLALRRAAKLAPGSSEALELLGNALRAAGRAREAAEEYTRCLLLEPGHARCQEGLESLVLSTDVVRPK